MRNHSLGWTTNKRADRRAKAALAAQWFVVFLSLVFLWGAWCIGWDFVESMPAAGLGAW